MAVSRASQRQRRSGGCGNGVPHPASLLAAALRLEGCAALVRRPGLCTNRQAKHRIRLQGCLTASRGGPRDWKMLWHSCVLVSGAEFLATEVHVGRMQVSGGLVMGRIGSSIHICTESTGSMVQQLLSSHTV
jgi:hypothetical protein